MSKAQRVVLVELLGQIPGFNLPHEVYCAGAGACSCTVKDLPMTELDKRTGDPVRVTKRVRRPKSITLAPKGKSVPLHPAVLLCPEVAAALKSRPRRIRSEPAK